MPAERIWSGLFCDHAYSRGVEDGTVSVMPRVSRAAGVPWSGTRFQTSGSLTSSFRAVIVASARVHRFAGSGAKGCRSHTVAGHEGPGERAPARIADAGGNALHGQIGGEEQPGGAGQPQ